LKKYFYCCNRSTRLYHWYDDVMEGVEMVTYKTAKPYRVGQVIWEKHYLKWS
jgi:hypothetical protein